MHDPREFQAGAPNGIGILFQPSGASKLYVSNTSVFNNGTGASGGGILTKPSGSATNLVTIVNTLVENNIGGITADGSGTTGTTVFRMFNTVSAGNTASGITVTTPAVGGGIVGMMIDRSAILNNATGINSAGVKSFVSLSNSTVAGNNLGLAASGSGSILSYKTNNILGSNVSDGTLTGTLSQN
jgi:hypothetical protein